MADTITGDPQALRALAQRWHRFADALDTTGKGLGGLETEPWQGSAQQAFAGYIERSSPEWLRSSEACRNAGDAVSRYADVLEWAQREAAGASPDTLDRIRLQVSSAGDEAAVSLRAASSGPSPIRTMQDDDEEEDSGPDVRQPNKWDDAPPGHPDPGGISGDRNRIHILWGDHENPEQESGGHIYDSGIPGKTVFPEDWDGDQIIETAEDLAANPDSEPVHQEATGNWRIEGKRDGVDMVVIVNDNGDIVTAYPTGGEGVARNDDEGEPQLLEEPPDEDGESTVDPEEEDQEAAEAEQDADEAEDDAQEHVDNAEAARDVGAEDTASEEYAAAEEDRDSAKAAEQLADRHRRTAEQAREADEDATPRWN